MSLHRRLERLEDAPRRVGAVASVTVGGGAPGAAAPAADGEVLHEIGQARRHLAGLVPEDDLPYTEEDRENDRRFLGETILAYRAGLGWQTEEAKAVLDYWQQQTLKRLEGD